MKRLKNWFVEDGTILLIVCVVAFVLVATSPLRFSVSVSPHAEGVFEPGQEVRLKANGGKAVVIRRVGGDYLVRYAEHDGRLNTLVMDPVELVDWPSSYQVAKPDPK